MTRSSFSASDKFVTALLHFLIMLLYVIGYDCRASESHGRLIKSAVSSLIRFPQGSLIIQSVLGGLRSSRVFSLEFFHKANKSLNTLHWHGVVDASSAASNGTMTLKVSKVCCG